MVPGKYKIEIRLYGTMAQFAPGDTETFFLTVAPGTALPEITRRLHLPDFGYVLLVNGRRQPPSYCVKDRDILVLFPEICGG